MIDSAVRAFKDEHEFKRTLGVGDWVLIRRHKRYTITGARYLTKGKAYKVQYVSSSGDAFFVRTTTNHPDQLTFISWHDIDPKPHKAKNVRRSR